MKPIVRAVDVGYGHVKFTQGRAENGSIVASSFPSQSPRPRAKEIADQNGALQRRDTFLVPAGEHFYEVGVDIYQSMGEDVQTEALGNDFCLMDLYAARLFGAINYMIPGLPERRIDYLALGLPLTTYNLHAKELAAKFTGTFTIDSRGTQVVIGKCFVYPQPLGGYATYVAEQALKGAPRESPQALMIDPGFFTVDYLVCKGMAPSPTYGALRQGMSEVINQIVASLCREKGFAETPALKRAVDTALTSSKSARIAGKDFDLTPHLAAGRSVIGEAAQQIKNKVGEGHAIDVIAIAGGGGPFYVEELRKHFRHHEVVQLTDPAFANVRGFQLLAERVAQSHARAASMETA